MTFERVLCGVDGSPASEEAVRQGARLIEPQGRLLLVSVCETHLAVHAGMLASEVLADLREEAESALAAAARELSPDRPAEQRLVEGRAADALLDLAAGEDATLLCVGSRGHRRASGILLGSTVTRLAHEAPCSVLVARPAPSGAFPSAIVAGLDGSPQAEAAASVALTLGKRFGAPVRLVVGTNGKGADAEGIAHAHPEAETLRAKRSSRALTSGLSR